MPDAPPPPTYSDPFAAAVERAAQQVTAVGIGGLYIAQAMAMHRAARAEAAAAATRHRLAQERADRRERAAAWDRSAAERRSTRGGRRPGGNDTTGPRSVAEEILTERHRAPLREQAMEATERAFGGQMARLIHDGVEFDAYAHRLMQTAARYHLRPEVLLAAARALGPLGDGEVRSPAGALHARLGWIVTPRKAGWATARARAQEAHDRLIKPTTQRRDTTVIDGQVVGPTDRPGQKTANARNVNFPDGRPAPQRPTTPTARPRTSPPPPTPGRAAGR